MADQLFIRKLMVVSEGGTNYISETFTGQPVIKEINVANITKTETVTQTLAADGNCEITVDEGLHTLKTYRVAETAAQIAALSEADPTSPSIFGSGEITTGKTAFATGGQGSAIAIDNYLFEISVCATAGDSAVLPAATVGLAFQIINNGAEAADVFPAVGDFLGSGLVNIATSVPALGGILNVYCVEADIWKIAVV